MKGDIKVKISEVGLTTRMAVNALCAGFNQLNARGQAWGGYANIGNASDACGKVARLFGVQNWTMADFRLLDARSMGVSKGAFTSRSASWFINELANWNSRRAMAFKEGRGVRTDGRNIPVADSFSTDSFPVSSIGDAIHMGGAMQDEWAPCPARVREYACIE